MSCERCGSPYGGGHEYQGRVATERATAMIAAMSTRPGSLRSIGRGRMAIARASVLTGHVLGNPIQTVIAPAVVIGVALLVGFDRTATATEWVTVDSLLALIRE